MIRHLALASILGLTVTACEDNKAEGAKAGKGNKADNAATEKLLTDDQRKQAGKPAEPGELK
jgi:hypothetical protein